MGLVSCTFTAYALISRCTYLFAIWHTFLRSFTAVLHLNVSAYGKGLELNGLGGLYREGRLALLGSYPRGLPDTHFVIPKIYRLLLVTVGRACGVEQDSSRTQGA
jgi:hypothetical protein